MDIFRNMMRISRRDRIKKKEHEIKDIIIKDIEKNKLIEYGHVQRLDNH
jgi:hypothetical protein